MSEPSRYVLVLSDLHFGDGGKLENFNADENFSKLLQYARGQGQLHGGAADIIINGDFIDFLQIPPLHHTSWRDASKKIEYVATAHKKAFGAMAEFLRTNRNRLIIIPGNHDIELHFRDVQNAFIQSVAKGDENIAARVIFPNDSPLGTHFGGWERGPFVYRMPGVYIEHGNQFDPLNCFDHADFFSDSEKKELIRLPWGSRFVLDVLNEKQLDFPFLDKIRPKSAAVLIAILVDPHQAFAGIGKLFGVAPHLVPLALRRTHYTGHAQGKGARGSDMDAFDPALLWLCQHADELEAIYDERAFLSAALDPSVPGHRGGRWSQVLAQSLARVGQAILGALTARHDCLREPDGYEEHAFRLAHDEAVEFVVFGHTHGVRAFHRDGLHYFNTGTWIDLLHWDADRFRFNTAENYAEFVDYIKSSMIAANLQSFLEVSYPAGRLDAQLSCFRDGEPLSLLNRGIR